MDQTLIVRPMLSSDLKNAMNLALTEGWNQTEKDWRLLLDNKSNKCFVSEDNGKVIGTATAINYASLEAWIGMVLVDKDYRRQGIGSMLMTGIIESLKGFMSVKLDATPAGQPVYQKLGFIEEYMLSRMVCTSFNGTTEESDPLVGTAGHEDMEDVIRFDSEIFGVDRTYLVNTIRKNYPHKAFVLKKNGKVTGYVLGRDGIRYNYIGPVFAQSSGDAIMLVNRALKTITPGSAIAVDIMNDKKELADWLVKNGFSVQREFTRMYLKTNPFPGKTLNQYLIIGPEFG